MTASLGGTLISLVVAMTTATPFFSPPLSFVPFLTSSASPPRPAFALPPSSSPPLRCDGRRRPRSRSTTAATVARIGQRLPLYAKPPTVEGELRNFPTENDEGGCSGGEDDESGPETSPAPPPSKLKSKRKKKAKASDAGPMFWRDGADPFSISVDGSEEGGTEETGRAIQFVVRGNPRPLQRHRTVRGGRFSYNPSAAAQEAFRCVAMKIIPSVHRPVIVDDCGDGIDEEGGDAALFFGPDEFLEISLLFRMKRPKNHFVGGKPGPGRIRPAHAPPPSEEEEEEGRSGSSHLPAYSLATRTDVDNLAKFVMDSLQGLLYDDDKRVVRLIAERVLDDEGDCVGATEVGIRAIGGRGAGSKQ